MQNILSYIPSISLASGTLGTVGACIAAAFGGWDKGIAALLIFMGIDYLTAIIVAAVFKNSPKSQNGGINSGAGFKGLVRKGMILLMVLVATQLDVVLNTNFIRDAVIIAYLANETVSVIENAGLMGVPIPSAIKKAIDILSTKSEEKTNEDKTE